jgi:threonylcarbamoyladenosine tRNA methylthiotransferase MtaB
MSSLEATEVTDDFVRVMADYPNRICPHLHLSLQSGSDRILAAMKRRYRMKTFLDRCEQLRRLLDEPALTTDIIVGFPGETEDDFEQTVNAVHAIEFSKLHLFPFSPRRGTPAADMPAQVVKTTVDARRRRLMAVGAQTTETYFKRLIGRRLEMLIESPDPAQPVFMRGTACRYAPLRLRTLDALAGRLVPVQATSVEAGVINVEPIFDAGPR